MANYVKFMRGTPKAYEMLLASPQKPNIDTLYFIYDDDAAQAKLYLGEKLIAGSGSSTNVGELVLGDLTDISLSTELKNKEEKLKELNPVMIETIPLSLRI